MIESTKSTKRQKKRQGEYTHSSKRCEEIILPGSKRWLGIWRSTLASIIIVIISKAEANDKQDFACDSRLLSRGKLVSEET